MDLEEVAEDAPMVVFFQWCALIRHSESCLTVWTQPYRPLRASVGSLFQSCLLLLNSWVCSCAWVWLLGDHLGLGH